MHHVSDPHKVCVSWFLAISHLTSTHAQLSALSKLSSREGWLNKKRETFIYLPLAIVLCPSGAPMCRCAFEWSMGNIHPSWRALPAAPVACDLLHKSCLRAEGVKGWREKSEEGYNKHSPREIWGSVFYNQKNLISIFHQTPDSLVAFLLREGFRTCSLRFS